MPNRRRGSSWDDESDDPKRDEDGSHFGEDDDFDDPEWPEPDDDETEDEEEVPCPNCGWLIYEGADRCPACGEYVVPATSMLHGKSYWYVLLIAVGITAVIATMLAL